MIRQSSPPRAANRARLSRRTPAKPHPAAQPRPLETPPNSKRSCWAALAILALFAAGFWQFALLDIVATPAGERVNNGRNATFFAVHINPYYTFSEDFHLYVVRAKRILDRGWTDSPLASRPGERASYAAPLQAALGMIAAQTDGKPVPYTAFMFALLGTAWCGLFLAARRWLPDSVSTRSILVAVLITVLFESLGGLTNRELEYAQWPVHRGLRLSTMAWTSPLALAASLAATSLLFDRRKYRSTAIALGLMLLMLAASDNWAFVTAFGTTGIVASILAAMALFVGCRRERLENGWKSVALLAVALGIVAAIHLVLGGAMTEDALVRGGMGKAWLSIPEPPDAPAFWGPVRRYCWTLVAMLGVVCIRLRIAGSRDDRQASASVALQPPDRQRLRILASGAVPVAAVLVLVPTLFLFVGMEQYHAFQFIWRAEYCIAFAVVLLASEFVKLALRHYAATPRIARRWEIAATLLVVVPLLGYHNYRIYRFVTRTAASEFFLTEDEEHLRDWLRSQPADHVRSLATASHELNYLCAYWTNADLLLPEGFPYHNAGSDEEIENRMTDLLRLYRATPDAWRTFNLHGHSDDQWSWHESRLRSAREGYSYYLMHRAHSIRGHTDPFDWARAPCESEKGTTALVAELRRREDRSRKIAAQVRHGTPIAAVEMVDRIARKLVERPGTPPRPDVIVVDEVSRALGEPDFRGYRRAFAHGTLEAWVRDDALAAKSQSALSGECHCWLVQQ